MQTDNLTSSTENLSLEQRYVLRNTHRIEPQGQENNLQVPSNENKTFLHIQTESAPAVSSSQPSSMQWHHSNVNKSISEARNPMFSNSNGATTSNRNSLKDPISSNRSSMDVSSSSYNTIIIHNDESIYGAGGLGLKKDRPSSLREQGVQEISEIPNDYLMESQVLKHLIANEMKISANKSRNFLNPSDRREGRASEAKTIKEKQKLNLIAEDSELLPFKTRCKSLPDLSILKCQFMESGIVESLSKENTLLKQQLQVSGKKVAKTQQLEEEIIKIYRDHEELVQSCNRREKLEKLARMKLQENLTKVQALNRALQAKVDLLPNPDNQLTETLLNQYKELLERKDRQDIELTAQQATLQEQRRHIAILDGALNNAQAQIRQLEEELGKKQMYIEHILSNPNLRDDYNNTEISKDSNRSGSSCNSNDKKWQIDDITGRPMMRRLEANQNNFEDPTMTPNSSKLSLDKIQDTEKIINEAKHDKIRFIEEVQCAQRKMSDLHSHVKNLESKVAEKEAFIRALKGQKKCSSYDSYNLPSDHSYSHLYNTPSSSSYSPALLHSSPAYTDASRGNESYPDQSTTSFNIGPNTYLAELDPNLNFMLQNADYNISTSSFDNKLVNVNEPSISKRRGLCCLPSLTNKIKQPLLSDEVSMMSTNQSDPFLQKLESFEKEHQKPGGQPKNKADEIVFLEKQGRYSQKNRGSGNLAQVTHNVGQNMTDISNIGIGSYKNTNTLLLPPRKNRGNSLPPSALPRPPRQSSKGKKLMEYDRLNTPDPLSIKQSNESTNSIRYSPSPSFTKKDYGSMGMMTSNKYGKYTKPSHFSTNCYARLEELPQHHHQSTPTPSHKNSYNSSGSNASSQSISFRIGGSPRASGVPRLNLSPPKGSLLPVPHSQQNEKARRGKSVSTMSENRYRIQF
ncbi:AMOTL1 family protein [Megaselia abdita]